LSAILLLLLYYSLFAVSSMMALLMACFVIAGVKHGWSIADVLISMQSFSPTRYFRHVTVGCVLIILKEVNLSVKRTTGSNFPPVCW